MIAAGTFIISVRRPRQPYCGSWIAECWPASAIWPRCPNREPDKLVSLEDFQADVQRALGKSFGEFVEASQSFNDAHCRMYRVVAEGTASDIPMRWLYYLVADPQGRQAAFTFAVERKVIDRFADADKPLVQSLQFVEERKEKRN